MSVVTCRVWGRRNYDTMWEQKHKQRSHPTKGDSWPILPLLGGILTSRRWDCVGALESLGRFVCLWWSLSAQCSKLRHFRSHWDQEGLRTLSSQRSSLLLTSSVKKKQQQQQQQRIIYSLYHHDTHNPTNTHRQTDEEDFNLPNQFWTPAFCGVLKALCRDIIPTPQSCLSTPNPLQDLKMNLPVACS